MAMKRLHKELKEFQIERIPFIEISVVDADSPTQWEAKLTGPAKTPYADGMFTLSLDFSQDYPFKPPTVLFKTKIYHPNVDEKGAVCLEMLKREKWKPATKVKTILEAIYGLLISPNPDDPLDADIAQQYTTDIAAFNKIAQEWTAKYAK